MFTAVFVLALVSKKIKIGHYLYVLFRDPFVKFKMGHEKLKKSRPIGSLTIIHLAKSGNKSNY
jgi:hypothetical protein